jgi:hypothetical protein
MPNAKLMNSYLKCFGYLLIIKAIELWGFMLKFLKWNLLTENKFNLLHGKTLTRG